MGPESSENQFFSPEKKEQDPIQFHTEAIQRFEEMERMIVDGYSGAESHADMLEWIRDEIEHHEGRIKDIEGTNNEE